MQAHGVLMTVTKCPYYAWRQRGHRRAYAGMDRVDGRLIVSATDLVGYLACGHLSVLDLGVLDGGLRKPDRSDPELEVLQRRGLEHEAAYLAALADAGLTVAEIAGPASDPDRLAALRHREADTVFAMRALAIREDQNPE